MENTAKQKTGQASPEPVSVFYNTNSNHPDQVASFPALADIDPGRYPQIILKKERPAFDEQLSNCSAWKRGFVMGLLRP